MGFGGKWMSPKLEKVKKTLLRKHLGKGGVHGLTIDEGEQSVTVYVDQSMDVDLVTANVKKDAGVLEVKTIASNRPSL